MSAPIRASVVIATRNRPEQLKECLDSVLRTIGVNDEVIVVDSASAQAEAVRKVAAESGVQLIRIERRGSARARNMGIRQSRGAIIAFTDDDARVEAGWLDALVSRFSDPGVAAVVGPVFELGSAPAAPLFSCGDYDPTRDTVRFNRATNDWFTRLRFGAIGVGANLAVRRGAFERYGLFRESLGRGAPISGDETYYLLTLVEEGETVVNEPRARVYHPRQTAEYRQQEQRCRIAYILYILLTRPQLRWRLARSLIRRVQRRSASQAPARTSALELGRAFMSAPALLIAARHIDRVSVASDCRQGF